MKVKFECTCDICKAACVNKPGWFLPGETEKAAKHLKLSMKKFFNQYLGVDWWVGSNPIFVLAPAIVGASAGSEYPGDPRGQCVFFTKGLCGIHPVKPFECAQMVCNEREDGSDTRHESVAMKWVDHQAQIVKLLGREPEETPFYGSLWGVWN